MDSHIVIVLFAVAFGFVHSGMAAMRPMMEPYISARTYRILFVLASFAIATPWLVYLVNHRNDGVIVFDLHNYSWLHNVVMFLSCLAFFFLYPGTYRLSEIVTINSPKQRFYDGGIIRITRHPQLIGMSLWCLSHTLWNGTTFMLAASTGLIGYHLFAAWHGDHRRLKMFGEDYAQVINTTSILPFWAIIQGKQKIVLKEFIDLAFLWIIIFEVIVYWLHPAMCKSFPNWFF